MISAQAEPLFQILKDRTNIRLPVSALVEQIASSTVAEGVKPFTMVYVEMGLARMPPADVAVLVPRILAALDSRSLSIQWSLVRCISPSLHLARPVPATSDTTATALHRLGLVSDATASVVMDVLQSILCLHNAAQQPVKGAVTRADAGATVVTGPAAEPKVATPPACLSWAVLTRLVGAAGTHALFETREKVIAAKLSVLKFIALEDVFADALIIPHLLIAAGMCSHLHRSAIYIPMNSAADSCHEVVDVAETELHRRLSPVVLEQPAVVSAMYRLLLGDPATQGTKASDDTRTSPPSTKLSTLLITHLTRSRLAPTMFPHALQAAFAAMFGAHGSPRFKTLGIQFTHRVFELAAASTLSTVAPVFLSSVMKIVRDAAASSQDTGLAIQAVGKLSLRCPASFASRADLLSELFEASVGSDSFVRSCVFDALTMMRSAFASPSEQTGAAILALCNQYILHTDNQARLLASQYAVELFPSQHMPSRWVCLQAAVDLKEDIKSEGERGLRRVKTLSATTSELTIDPLSQIVSFPDAVSFVANKVATKKASGTWLPSSYAPPFNGPLFSRVLTYLRHCLGVSGDADEDETTYLLRTGGTQPRLFMVSSYLQTLDMVPEYAAVIDGYLQLLDYALVCTCGHP